MAKIGWTGLESAGKSQLMAVKATRVLARNERWMKKRKKMGLETIPRTMAFDTPMSESFISACERIGVKYLFFYDLSEVLHLNQLDLFINEINKFFPARGSDPLTMQQAEFLSQAAKDGIDIYFCTQDFSQAHKQFRFLVNRIYYVVKVAGSRRPVLSAPPVRLIWGLCLIWSLAPSSFKGDNMSMRVQPWAIFPSFYFINRYDTQLYDTSYKVRGTNLPPVYMALQKVIYLLPDGGIKEEKTRYVKR